MKKILLIILIIVLFIAGCYKTGRSHFDSTPKTSTTETPPPSETSTQTFSPSPPPVSCKEEETECGDYDPIKCCSKGEYCGVDMITGEDTCLPRSGTCCKCFWYNTPDHVGSCAEGRCGEWFDKPEQADCDPTETIELEAYEDLTDPENSHYACEPKYAVAKYEIKGHSEPESFEPVVQFCEMNYCPLTIMGISGCSTCEDFQTCEARFREYRGSGNIYLVGNIWPTCNRQTDTQMVLRRNEGCTVIEYPSCDYIDSSPYCVMTGVTIPCQKNIEVLDNEEDPIEYRACCCDSTRDYSMDGNGRTPGGYFRGKPITVSGPDSTCPPSCTTGRDEGGNFITVGHDSSCSKEYDHCGTYDTGGDYAVRNNCNIRGYAGWVKEECKDGQICIDWGGPDGNDPICVLVRNPFASPTPTTTATP